MSRTSWFGAVLAVAVLTGVLWIVYGPQPSDQDQINQALRSAIKASREGRPGGVVEYLTDSFKVNGASYDVSRQVSDVIHKYHPDIELTSTKANISGEHATVTTDVDLRVLKKTLAIPDVTFALRKETSTKWLIFPSKNWKLEGASLPPTAVPAVISQMPDLGVGQGGPFW